MRWEVDAASSKHVRAIAEALKDDRKLILATDPDREGEAISWHLLEALTGRKAVRKDTQVERVVFNAITKSAVTAGDGEAARRRHGAGRRLPRPPRPRLSRRLPPVAGALAQAARRQVRRPRPVGGAAADRRPRDGDRGLPRPRVLDGQGAPRHPARRHLRGPPRRPRRQEARQVRPRRRGRRHPRRRRDRGPRPRRHRRRVEARHPQPVRPVHDLDAAAGGEPQVRHGRAPDDERRAAALRGRPHHLHAHRRHRHGAGGGDGRPRRDQGPLRRRLTSPPRRACTRTRPRTPRRPTSASARPT